MFVKVLHNEALSQPETSLRDTAELGSIPCPVVQCHQTFTRKDSAQRHVRSKHKNGQASQIYGCSLCRKSFTRKDHRRQHLRQFHRVEDSTASASIEVVYCYHEACHSSTPALINAAQFRQGFATNAELYKHIRKVHRDTPFQCSVYACNNVGPNGWFRRSDRAAHQRKEHAGMDEGFLDVMNSELDGRMPEYLARKQAR